MPMIDKRAVVKAEQLLQFIEITVINFNLIIYVYSTVVLSLSMHSYPLSFHKSLSYPLSQMKY